MFYICDACGASLDPGEICDCSACASRRAPKSIVHEKRIKPLVEVVISTPKPKRRERKPALPF